MNWIAMALLVACNAAFAQGENLAKARQCFDCHQMTKKTVGPSFSDIAHRYRFDRQALNAVMERILEGSVGSWGVVPMPASQAVSQEEARQLATWILNTPVEESVKASRTASSAPPAPAPGRRSAAR